MFRPRRLVWQIIPVNLLTIIAAVLAVSWYGGETIEEFYLQETEKDLEARARLVAPQVLGYLARDSITDLRHYCLQAGRGAGMRLTVILADGRVVADSNEDPTLMDNHAGREEVALAMAGSVGKARRYSRTVSENMVYVALPLITPAGVSPPLAGTGGGVVIRTAISVASLDRALAGIRFQVGLGTLAVLAVASLATLLLVRNISRPLEEMTVRAEQFSKGDFRARLSGLAGRGGSLEVAILAAAMDRMAEQLDEKIQTINTHRNQLETVFASMVEAVVAVDRTERVFSINAAAASLFGVERARASGMLVQQLVRNLRLQEQISRCLSSREAGEEEIALAEGFGQRFLRSHVVSLSNSLGEHVGVLVVLNDITRLRRLEHVRRDFVANVSHELRTPITSILGYVETLLDGALERPEEARRFLEIVLRQARRLTGIIDDLLVLSRIEEESSRGAITRQPARLAPVIDQAVQTCQLAAEQAGVALEVSCPEELTLPLNPALLEQALVNLLVNGIAYSKPGGVVTIEAGQVGLGQEVRLVVSDRGCGIANEHLPRLFERFYRSDQGRSRAKGGTGLGLAIVKHIVQAHHGTVAVASTLGEGTSFTLVLPGENGES